MVLEETSLLRDISHEFIINLVSTYKGEKEVIVVTEYLSGGELFEKVASEDYNLTESECIKFMHQICEGVAYLHKNVSNLKKNVLLHEGKKGKRYTPTPGIEPGPPG